MKAENLRSSYDEVKADVNTAWGELRTAAIRSHNQPRERILTEAKNAADVVDTKAHTSPWQFMAATGAVAALSGFMLGRKSKHI